MFEQIPTKFGDEFKIVHKNLEKKFFLQNKLSTEILFW